MASAPETFQLGEYRKVWGNHAAILILDDGFSPNYA